MATSHWFDKLSASLTPKSGRRGFLGLAGALFTGAASVGSKDAALAKGRGKSGKNKQGKNHRNKGNKGNKKPAKPPEPPDHSDVPAICRRTWPYPDQAADREWCKFISEQCPPGDDEQFCIVRNGGSKIADCCETGEACCNETCRDIWSDSLNCGACDRRCLLYETCIAGDCYCDIDIYDECPDGCVNTLRDPHNCGSCGNECPFWTVCINGECKCPPDRVPCDTNPNLPYPACIRPTDICCSPYVCSGGKCCLNPSSGQGQCFTECPAGWSEREA